MKGRMIKLILGVLAAGLFSYLFLRRPEIKPMIISILSVDFTWLIGTFSLFLPCYAARIARWQLVLTLDNPIVNYPQCTAPFIASFALLNNVQLFRREDTARACSQSAMGVGPELIRCTLIAERLLDLLAILLLGSSRRNV